MYKQKLRKSWLELHDFPKWIVRYHKIKTEPTALFDRKFPVWNNSSSVSSTDEFCNVFQEGTSALVICVVVVAVNKDVASVIRYPVENLHLSNYFFRYHTLLCMLEYFQH